MLFASLLANVALSIAGTVGAEAIPVELRQVDGRWQLLRGGEPYFIRGAGGDGSLAELAAAGGNSIRTWGADDIDELLDEAHALGLSVTVGIWLGHERHGFDYDDPEQVREQFEHARDTVLRYRNHPAVLLWGVGNETEGFEAGDNPKIWAAINDIASMIKTIDPAHPTMAVTAELGGDRIKGVHQLCPAIDIHGINAYGGVTSLPDRYRAGGATKPFVLTEFGPPGAWETETTAWGAPFEMNSTQKADFVRNSYQKGVLGAPGLALGSYAFTWGHKMEATATWFGLFLADGARLAAIDTLSTLWSGRSPANQAPRLASLQLEPDAREVAPKSIINATIAAEDPESAELRAHWALRQESFEYATGGDFRPTIPDIDNAIVESDTTRATIRMPAEPGAYRLFYYAYDDSGKAATANMPLLVKGAIRTRFPVHVYHDSFAGMPWSPSGWMGGIDKLTLDDAHSDNPHAGASCIKMHYTGEFGWAGVAWQDPPNNWGERPGGHDLTGAKFLELWARGEYGGEKISIGVGIIGDDQPHPDSSISKVDDIWLDNVWRQYRVPLKRADVSSIKTGFVVTLSGRRTPVTVYLDSIRFVR